MKRGMMPTATPDNPMGQSQKYMAYIMPFFALSGLYWPFGLVLYWVTTNLWTLGQQYVLFMRYPQPLAAGGAAEAPALRPGQARSQPPAPDANGSAGTPGSGQGKPAAAGRDKQPGRTARPRPQGKPAGGKPAAAAGPSANGKSAGSAGGGGMLRRLGRGRAEPEPQAEAPEVKLVRQQRQRQSRSKR